MQKMKNAFSLGREGGERGGSASLLSSLFSSHLGDGGGGLGPGGGLENVSSSVLKPRP
jgi:hypothetical protein